MEKQKLYRKYKLLLYGLVIGSVGLGVFTEHGTFAVFGIFAGILGLFYIGKKYGVVECDERTEKISGKAGYWALVATWVSLVLLYGAYKNERISSEVIAGDVLF